MSLEHTLHHHEENEVPLTSAFVPTIVTMTPAAPTPGSTVSVTVGMSGYVTTDTVVSIVGTFGYWSFLPSTVTVLNGNNSVTFTATVAAQPCGDGWIGAGCNGAWAEGEIDQPLPPGLEEAA